MQPLEAAETTLSASSRSHSTANPTRYGCIHPNKPPSVRAAAHTQTRIPINAAVEATETASNASRRSHPSPTPTRCSSSHPPKPPSVRTATHTFPLHHEPKAPYFIEHFIEQCLGASHHSHQGTVITKETNQPVAGLNRYFATPGFSLAPDLTAPLAAVADLASAFPAPALPPLSAPPLSALPLPKPPLLSPLSMRV